MKNTLTEHQQSALDINNNIALTANAGSGKTYVLSKRFLEIALNADVPLRKIAAITFTEKAASELYKKITAQLEELLSLETDNILIDKLNRIRRSLVSANISTIHSFCINLLREYPVEAELDANFIPVDTQISGELIELSIDEVIKKALTSEDDAPKIKSLIRLFSSRRILSAELFQLVANRKNVIGLKELYHRPSGEIAEYYFNSFLKTVRKYLDKNLPAFSKTINNIVNEVLDKEKTNSIALSSKPYLYKLSLESHTEELLNIISELLPVICTQKGEIRKILTKRIDPQENDLLLIREFYYDLSYFCIQSNHKQVELELASTGKEIIYFFDKILQRYEEKKQKKGYLDFEDILLFTKKLMEDKVIRKSVWQKFDFIMIDEYQDTNEIQYEIFLPILDYLKRGNLFVVGDEKQSIYMFRDAELEVFDKTKQDIRTSNGGKLLMLPDSFRMGPEICLFTNHIFKRLFADPELLFNEVAHSELVCARQEPSPWGEVQFLLEDEETGISEASLLARKILQLKEEGKINWNSVAILTRKRSSFDEIEESFVLHNIPYIIMGGRNFYQRQSIYDIYNYFSFLLDSNDEAALAGVLRSPFYNLSDADLYSISVNQGKNLFQKLLNSRDESLKQVQEKLREMISEARFQDAPELLRKMLEESGFLAFLSSKKNGEQETANIRKLIRVTINYYSQGMRTLYDYVNFLKINISQTEDEAQALIADDSNTVKIMTIHQAKGLEFSVVFLFNSDESALQTVVKQKNIIVSKDFGILTKVPLNENYYEDYEAAPVVNINNFIAVKKNNAELKRLLYVAITRAKDSLYITACKKNKYVADSFMGVLAKALDQEFSPEGFNIQDEVKFLVKYGHSYIEESRNISLNIPVQSDLPEYGLNISSNIISKKNIYVNGILDSPKDEIISATRYSVYRHCPVSYKFTYQEDLIKLINFPLISEDSDEERDENFIPGIAGIKGRVIHKILQLEKEDINKEDVRLLVKREDHMLDDGALENLSCQILSDVSNFFSSEVFKQIRMKGRNEFEVYFRENDYILFGIIDKIIIEEDVITIIDYKTDDIPEEKTIERAQDYSNQLKFYSYIIWQTFNCTSKIFYKIIFIKHPDKIFVKEEKKEDLLNTGLNIREMVINTRNNIYSPDRTYCSKCIFSDFGVNCIKKAELK